MTGVRVGMEIIVGVMVCISPWFFGAVREGAIFWLYVGVALLLLLWAARVLLEGKADWKPCPLTWCLAGLFLLSVIQLVPMPSFLLGLLSPTQQALCHRMLPAQPEVLPDGATPLTDGLPAGNVLSLYPAATRSNAIKLLAVCLLFAVVRNNIASAAALTRLSVLVLVNGALMSLFALVQFFSSSGNMLYWTYPAEGRIFGPFVYASHYAFYINIAIGLGVGLLLAAQHLRRRRHRDEIEPELSGGWLAVLLKPLHDPLILWISVALALMVASVFVSLSRGGILTLALSAAVVLTIKVARWRRLTPFEIAVPLLVVAVGVFTWWSLPQVEDRMATIWSGTAAASRLPSWLHFLPLVADFPLVGSGLGTFPYVEPLHRPFGPKPLLMWEHAHNDYLEALIEGGVLRLGLSLVAIGVVYRLGWRALARHRRRLAGGLALGAVFAFTTIVVHSFGDFGLHMPAIAVLATVVTAHLAELGKARRRRRKKNMQPTESATSGPLMTHLASIGSSVLLALLALLLYGEGSRTARAEGFRMAADRLASNSELTAMERQLNYFEAAVRATPEDATIHFELAQAMFDQYQKERPQEGQRQEQTASAAQATKTIAGLAPSGISNLGAAVFWASRASGALRDPASDGSSRAVALRRKYLVPALAHGMRARDLCPLLSTVQLWLADQAGWFVRADRREVYLARARELRPCHPTIWYLLGAEELAQGRTELAWFNWHQSLLGSDQHLPEILAQTRKHLPPLDIRDRVLPDKPELLIKAAKLLYPEDANRAERTPFLEKALVRAGRPDRAVRGEDLVLQGRILDNLDRPADAVLAYQRALMLEPERLEWRMQLAELLFRQRNLAEARQQLVLIVTAQPNHRDAHALLDAIEQER